MSGPVYTGTGDSGETSLADGRRVRKDDLRVRAYGALDEANSAIGLVRASLQVTIPEEAYLDRPLHFAQHRLMNCATRVAFPQEPGGENTPTVTGEDVARLEEYIDDLTARTGEAGRFVLPTGCEEAARCHLARTIVRRAERELVALAAAEPVDAEVLRFVNRLSDLMFMAARYANAVYGTGDVFWDPEA